MSLNLWVSKTRGGEEDCATLGVTNGEISIKMRIDTFQVKLKESGKRDENNVFMDNYCV